MFLFEFANNNFIEQDVRKSDLLETMTDERKDQHAHYFDCTVAKPDLSNLVPLNRL